MAWTCTVALEAYHDWSGEAVDAQLHVNFMLKLLLSQNFCNRPLFISFASNIGPAAVVPAGPAPAPLMQYMQYLELSNCYNHPDFFFKCFSNKHNSQTLPNVSWKSVKHKSVQH